MCAILYMWSGGGSDRKKTEKGYEIMRETKNHKGIEYVLTGRSGANAVICKQLNSRFATEAECLAAIDFSFAPKKGAEETIKIMASKGFSLKSEDFTGESGDWCRRFFFQHQTGGRCHDVREYVPDADEAAKNLCRVEIVRYDDKKESATDFFGEISGMYL